jgi:hypothetical protein
MKRLSHITHNDIFLSEDYGNYGKLGDHLEYLEIRQLGTNQEESDSIFSHAYETPSDLLG